MGSVFDLLNLINDKMVQKVIFIMIHFTNNECTIKKQKWLSHRQCDVTPRSKFSIKVIK